MGKNKYEELLWLKLHIEPTSPIPRIASVAPLMSPTVVAMLSV